MFLQRRSRELLDNDELQVECFVKKFVRSGQMSHVHKILWDSAMKKLEISGKKYRDTETKIPGTMSSHRTQTLMRHFEILQKCSLGRKT